MMYVATKNVRHKLVYGFMNILAPKLRKDVRKAMELACNEVPRPFTRMLSQIYGRSGIVGCEIGFGYGENASSLLEELNLVKLYCVDPYFGSRVYDDTGVVVSWYLKKNKQNYDDLIGKLWRTDRVQFVHDSSDNAFDHLLPYDLDFVYIDGCHTRDYCYRDIVNSMKHVKSGGFVGGHDFANGTLTGVYEAVFQYSFESGLRPVCVYPDFWFRVP